jgi:DNA-binding transcriptional LysR family regulator
MANLDDILIFVKVAQFESISRASRSLGMPISTVSRRHLRVSGSRDRTTAVNIL